MKTLLKTLAVLVVIGMVGNACDKRSKAASAEKTNETSERHRASSTSSSDDPTGRYLLDASSASACENYLKGKTFTGGTARLKFGYDGTVSAFDPNGDLVFGGTLEIGSAKSDVSRWVYARNMSGGGKLQFLLSNDGKMMEPSSLVIYKPE